jgi:protoporphyrin/coproporphyrin ferrochelatase
MAFVGEGEYVHGSGDALGVLLVNLGTPDAPTPAALRRYLAEFLWDPRVVEIPRPLWWLILHGVILRTRPARSAKLYAKVWQKDGSPLLAIGQRQTQALRELLKQRIKGPVHVELAMRYGNPSIAAALEKLRAARVRRLLVLPMYPQYSATTTASTFDAIAQVLKTWRWIPELRCINQYHDDPAYIQALANSIREAQAQHGTPEKLLFSFHGIPRRNLLLGDPYHCQCQKTARLVAEQLSLAPQQWQITFQSRFGRAEWLKPYLLPTLEELARNGVKNVQVVCPGFSADCLETLEEIDGENRHAFLHAGGETFHYIPALNERADHLHLLASLVQCHTHGWPETDPLWNSSEQHAQQTKSRDRALAAGAAK